MPCDKPLQSMRSFHRQSTAEDFVLSPESPLPEITQGGARVKVNIIQLLLGQLLEHFVPFWPVLVCILYTLIVLFLMNE